MVFAFGWGQKARRIQHKEGENRMLRAIVLFFVVLLIVKFLDICLSSMFGEKFILLQFIATLILWLGGFLVWLLLVFC
jgi:hypothetical protein